MHSVRDNDEVLRTSKRLIVSLQSSSTADDFCRAVVNVALRSQGALSAVVANRNNDGLVNVLGSHGFSDSVIDANSSLSLFENRGLTDSIRKNTALFFDSALEYSFRYPLLKGNDYPGEGLVVIPVVAGSRAIGCVSVSFQDRLNPSQRESEFWDIFPLLCGAFLQFGETRLKAPSEYLRSFDF
jgi:hypothetical protein